MARRISWSTTRHRPVRDARSRLPAVARDANRRIGSRPPDVGARRLRTFLRRKEASLAIEADTMAKFDKRLAEEEAWLRQGIKARRTRNEGRVRALHAMRETRAARRSQIGSVRLQNEIGERSRARWCSRPRRRVFDARRHHRSSRSEARSRGDRVGLIGPNGSGKTTLLRSCSAICSRTGRSAAWHEPADRVLRSAARAARSRAHRLGDRRRRSRYRDGQRPHAACPWLPARFPLLAERALSPVKALSGVSATVCCSPGSSPVRSTCWCSTSRRTISTSKRWNCSRSGSPRGRERCCSSATIAPLSITSSRARSFSKAKGGFRIRRWI